MSYLMKSCDYYLKMTQKKFACKFTEGYTRNLQRKTDKILAAFLLAVVCGCKTSMKKLKTLPA